MRDACRSISFAETIQLSIRMYQTNIGVGAIFAPNKSLQQTFDSVASLAIAKPTPESNAAEPRR